MATGEEAWVQLATRIPEGATPPPRHPCTASYIAEHKLDDHTRFLRRKGTIDGHELESLEVIIDDDEGLIVDRTIAYRPFPALKLFREKMSPILKDLVPADLWDYSVTQEPK